MSRIVAADERVPPSVNDKVPTIARVYDYWLGGKDNFAVDRELAEKLMQADPMTRAGLLANRAFLGRAVRFLAGEAGIRQFLDIGTGIPTANNVHEIAQSVDPGCRVVYVDHDPMVLAHARALLKSVTAPTAYIDADDPHRLVAELTAAVPPGSYLAISHPASDIRAGVLAQAAMMSAELTVSITPRPYERVVPFFDGLDLVDPGIVAIPQWRPDPGADTAPLPGWVGVAAKPAR